MLFRQIHSSLSIRSSAIVPKFVIKAKWPLICLLTSTFFTKWLDKLSLISFNPIGMILGFALFNTYFKMLSCFVFTFRRFIEWWVFYKVLYNSLISLTPPIEMTLLIFFPPFSSIDLLTKARINSEPKL